jgi:pimeloyl-ACP methyl ester carboxylesterase
MEMVRHEGRETAYRRVGDSGVLYVHGSGAAHNVWVNQYARDGGSVAVDLSGHGRSDDIETPAGPETLAAYGEDVAAVARQTGADVIVGNSLGGAVAQHVVLEHDLPLSGVVLVGTGPVLSVDESLDSLLAEHFEKATEVLHRPDLLFHDADPATLRESKTAMQQTGQAVTLRDFRTCSQFDSRDRLGDIDIPTLVINGVHDGMTPPELHDQLEKGIPDARRVEIPDAAHLPFVERPGKFNETVDRFVTSSLA